MKYLVQVVCMVTACVALSLYNIVPKVYQGDTTPTGVVTSSKKSAESQGINTSTAERLDIADYLKQGGAVSGDQESVLGDALYKGDVETVKRVLEGGYSAKDFRYAIAAISNSYQVCSIT